MEEKWHKNLSLNTVQEIEIVPKTSYGYTTYFVHIIYKKEIPEIKPKRDKLMGIDFGVKNLASIVIEENPETFIIDGSHLISRLRLLAKEKAKIQSVISKQGYKTSQKFHNLIIKENNFVKDYIHKVSRHIVELAKESGAVMNADIKRTSPLQWREYVRNEKSLSLPYSSITSNISLLLLILSSIDIIHTLLPFAKI
jgi:transposase